MGNDFSHMLIRTDTDSEFIKVAGSSSSIGANDFFYFYSEAPGAFDSNISSSSKSPYSIVGYWIDPNVTDTVVTPFQLLRFDKGLTWDTASTGTVSLPATGPPVFGSGVPPSLAKTWPNEIATGTLDPISTPTTTNNYSVLSDGVFRMEITFLLNNGNYADTWYYNTADQYGLQDVTAIVVTIAILDPKTQKMLSSRATQLSEIAAKLVDSNISVPNPTPSGGLVATGGLVASRWQNEITGANGTDYATSMAAASVPVPLAIARQVRVFQHTFYLNKY
jgi:hypothetical protein